MKIPHKMMLTLTLLVAITTCCSGTETLSSPTPTPTPKIVHTYYSVGDTIDAGSYDYTINSVKVDNSIASREGNKWIVLDITFSDTAGKEDSFDDYANMYGEFVLIDNENYIYKSYNKVQRTEFYGTTRDFVLFLVPVSKNEFILFDEDVFFDKIADIDETSRNIVKITLPHN